LNEFIIMAKEIIPASDVWRNFSRSALRVTLLGHPGSPYL
jgi:hypothetical protein